MGNVVRLRIIVELLSPCEYIPESGYSTRIYRKCFFFHKYCYAVSVKNDYIGIQIEISKVDLYH